MPEGATDDTTVDDFDDTDDQGAGSDDGTGKGTKNRVEVKDGKVFVDGEEFDAERALTTITNQRGSERELKKQLAEVQKQLKAVQNKDKPVDQQLSAERDELRVSNTKLEARLQRQTLRSEALDVATTMKFKNPSLAYKLIDADDVEWDDETPTNVNELLKKEAKANPYLLRRGRRVEEDEEDDGDDGADGGKGHSRSSSGKNDMNDRIRAMAGHD